MRKIRTAATAIGVVILLSWTAPLQAAQYTINWYLGHPNLDYFEEAAAEFKMVVEARSQGEIKVNIVTADEDALGPPEIAAKVESGEVEMGHSYTDVMGTVDPRLMVFEAPYLFRGHRHMEGLIEGPIGAELLDGLRDHKMIGLCLNYSGGGSGLATLNRTIRGPKDLKGMKVGVYGDPVNNAWLKSLGAIPVAIKHDLPSISRLARDGSLDAVVITWRNFARSDLAQEFRFFTMPNSTYLVSITYINEKFYNSLPAAYQTLIREESLKSARIERAKTIQLNEDAKREMIAQGVRQIHLTGKNRRAFTKALRPAYRDSIEDLIGKDLLERVRKTKDSHDYPIMPEHIASSD